MSITKVRCYSIEDCIVEPLVKDSKTVPQSAQFNILYDADLYILSD